MIEQGKNFTKLAFGNGDIAIAGGYSVYEGEKRRDGFVVFDNQTSRPIGAVGDIGMGRVHLEPFPVAMTFTSMESIDVLISKLEEVKEYMKGEEE